GVYHLAAQSLGDFPLLSRALASGALDWSRDWSDGSTFSAIDVDASGRAIVAGAREERPVVERLGLDGATSWRREIELGAEVAGEAAVVRALPDGGSLVAGPRRCDGFGCGAWVARLAGDGAVASLATLELGDFMAGDPQSILAYDDGGAYVAGAVVGHASPNRWFLARLTPDGVVEWLRAEPSTEGRSRFGELQPRAGGGVYALRSDGSSAIDGNATLLAFSPTGASAGSLRLDPPEGRTEACGLSLDAAGRLRVLVATHSEGIVPDRKTDFWHLVVDPTVGVLATNKEPALARPGEILGAAAIGPGDDLWILGTAAKSIRLTSWELTRIARGGGVAWTRDVGAVEVAMVPPPGDLGVDGEGYAYVLTQDQTGQGPGTRLRQFDPRGDATWVVDLPPVAFVGSKPRIAGVGAGALLAAAEATGDGALLRIRRASRTGDLAEVAELGPYSFVAPYDLEIGRQGDFWVSGEAEGRCLVAGWRADGTSILHFELPSETGPTSGCLDLALSSDGAVLAAGYAGAFSEKSLALRVTPTGELDWLQLSAGFPVHVARWTAVDVDEKGHVTFGGSSRAGEETRLLWTHLDAQGDELWSKSELVRPGDAALQVSDRGDRVGILTVDGIHAADGRPRVRLRLFGRASGAVSSELVLPQGSGLSASGPTIPLATRAGRTIVTGTALRASADLWAVEVSGTGDLFFDDFETGNLDGWSDLAPRD
ncbi:MAG: hypothetical protein KDB94_13625, partial [Acidobacteria bacterium]|nr:hypothetical protein [Acidobacteriota bacterium]